MPVRVALGALIVVVQFIGLAVYLEQERTIHFWDYAMYANMALGLFDAPRGTAALSMFYGSFAQKYNLLFALPSMVSFALAEPTRSIFILTNYLCYFIAFQAGIAFVLRQLYKLTWEHALFASGLLCVLVPFAWHPLLQGYPDHGAAACLTFAIGLALSRKPRFRTYMMMGALLGFSILFRRHYAYPVLAVLAAQGLCEIVFAFQKGILREPAWYKEKAVQFGLIGLSLLAVLVACEPLYLQEILMTDYAALYKSYERPPCYFVLFAFSRVGAGLLALSLIGYGLQAYVNGKNKKRLLFIGLVMVLWLTLWALGPGQAGDHYLISIMPLFCAVGLYGFVRALWHESRNLKIFLGICILFLMTNSAYAFWLSPFPLPSETPRFGLWSHPRPPWVRGDLPELERLARYIQNTTTDEDRVVIVGSSFLFNQDLVRAVYTDVIKDVRPVYRYLFAPESDGEQDPPMDAYAAGTVFIVATPTQYHLPPDGQKVVTALATRFPPASDAEVLFRKDAPDFVLDQGITVEVWRRTAPWKPGQLYQKLSDIRRMKNMERRWISLNLAGFVVHDQSGTTIIDHTAGNRTTRLFYDIPLSEGQFRFMTRPHFSEGCETVHLIGTTADESGKVLSSEKIPVVQSEGDVYIPFKISAKSIGQTFFTLGVDTKSLTQCTVALKQLEIHQNDIQGLP